MPTILLPVDALEQERTPQCQQHKQSSVSLVSPFRSCSKLSGCVAPTSPENPSPPNDAMIIINISLTFTSITIISSISTIITIGKFLLSSRKLPRTGERPQGH